MCSSASKPYMLRCLKQIETHIKSLDLEYDVLNEIFSTGDLDGFGEALLGFRSLLPNQYPIDLFLLHVQVLGQSGAEDAKNNHGVGFQD